MNKNEKKQSVRWGFGGLHFLFCLLFVSIFAHFELIAQSKDSTKTAVDSLVKKTPWRWVVTGYGGYAIPTGSTYTSTNIHDLNSGFARPAFTVGGNFSLHFSKYIGIAYDLQFAVNRYTTSTYVQYPFSVTYTPSNYLIISNLFGPVFTLPLKRLNIDGFFYIGNLQLQTPQININGFAPGANVPSYSGNTFAYKTGLTLRYDLTPWLCINTQFAFTSTAPIAFHRDAGDFTVTYGNIYLTGGLGYYLRTISLLKWVPKLMKKM